MDDSAKRGWVARGVRAGSSAGTGDRGGSALLEAMAGRLVRCGGGLVSPSLGPVSHTGTDVRWVGVPVSDCVSGTRKIKNKYCLCLGDLGLPPCLFFLVWICSWDIPTASGTLASLKHLYYIEYIFLDQRVDGDGARRACAYHGYSFRRPQGTHDGAERCL